MQLETFYIKLQIPTGLSTFQEASYKLSTLVTRGEYDIILRKWTWSKTSVDNRPLWSEVWNKKLEVLNNFKNY